MVDPQILQKARDPSSPPEGVVEELVGRWTRGVEDVASLIPWLARSGMSVFLRGHPPSSHQKVRGGKILGYLGNRKYFSFLLRVWDRSVDQVSPTGEVTTGAPRSWTLFNVLGDSKGWKDFQVEGDLTPEEREFLEKEEFVSPRRAEDFFQSLYLTTKAAVGILEYRGEILRSQMDFVESQGVHLPPTHRQNSSPPRRGVSAQVENLSAELDSPWVDEPLDLPPPPSVSTEGLERVRSSYHRLVYCLLPQLRYFTRLTEYAWLRSNRGSDFPQVQRGRDLWYYRPFGETTLCWRSHTVTVRGHRVHHPAEETQG